MNTNTKLLLGALASVRRGLAIVIVENERQCERLRQPIPTLPVPAARVEVENAEARFQRLVSEVQSSLPEEWVDEMDPSSIVMTQQHPLFRENESLGCCSSDGKAHINAQVFPILPDEHARTLIANQLVHHALLAFDYVPRSFDGMRGRRKAVLTGMAACGHSVAVLSEWCRDNRSRLYTPEIGTTTCHHPSYEEETSSWRSIY